MDNLEKWTDTFSSIFQDWARKKEIMNNPIISTVIKNLPQTKSPGSDSLKNEMLEFYQTFREELMPILLELFQKTVEEGTLPNLLYEATITLIPKPGKNDKKKKKNRKLQTSVTDEHRCNNPPQNSSKQKSTTH